MFEVTDDEVLRWIKRRLSTKCDVRRVILFGSRATGQARPDSDYDVLAIVRTRLPFVRRQAEARTTLGRCGFPLDLLVYTEPEASSAGAITGSPVYWAFREGVELDAAS